MRLKRGVLIVFEGIDGSGKSTQANNLFHALSERSFKAVYFSEPTQGKWGRIIKEKAAFPESLSPEEELKLFQRDREENVEKNLKPALRKKQMVILDRYYFSTIAYQGAKGIDTERIRKLNEKIAVEPDLVFILDLDAKKGLNRIENRKKKDLLFEREDYLVRVRQLFLQINGDNIFHVNADRSEEEISKEIKQIVFAYLNRLTL
ncbi:MAG: dTMP kinase [Candidatus Aminicenantes bacterium]|nr:dTMP kinase [Candidatus Aminicenantes bacterium]